MAAAPFTHRQGAADMNDHGSRGARATTRTAGEVTASGRREPDPLCPWEPEPEVSPLSTAIAPAERRGLALPPPARGGRETRGLLIPFPHPFPSSPLDLD